MMKKYILCLMFFLGLCLIHAPAMAVVREYNLVIEKKPVNVTGTEVERITVNGTIPGPELVFDDGDDAVIHVTNKMDEATSIHWHGLLLPGNMDGVPGFNGFNGIDPNTTFTYNFKIRQTGTYWYHAHVMGQEQDGLYGAFVIKSKMGERPKAARDYTIVLSDFSLETADEILGNLKMSGDYYNKARTTVVDFMRDAYRRGIEPVWTDTMRWGDMRMSPTDLGDVTGYSFLVNGKTEAQNWTGLYKRGEKVRVRIVNASSMTIFDFRVPGLKMEVVSADGQNIEPVMVDEFRIAPAETYDVILSPKDGKAYTLVAESLDRSGFATATIATRQGDVGARPEHRPRARLSMMDMGMDHGAMGDMDHADMQSGWANAHTPKGHKALSYEELRFLGKQKDVRAPTRDVEISLDGNMDRYVWTMDGVKYDNAPPIEMKYGERLRLTFINKTMMAHPMHLHGMFMQLENGATPDKMPNKHTVLVPPGQSLSVQVTADERGEWPLHCHLLFHMLSGMMRKVTVGIINPEVHHAQ